MDDGDLDAAARELVAERLAEAAHREFARAIGRLAGRRDDAEDAREVDDMRLRPFLEMRQEQHRAMHDAPEIDAHEPLDVIERELSHGADERHAGIVDDEIDAAVCGENGVAKRRHLLARGDVDPVRRDAPPGRSRFHRDCRQRLDIDIGKRQLAALAREAQRQRAPNAARGSGDDRDRAGERAHRLNRPGDRRWARRAAHRRRQASRARCAGAACARRAAA